MRERIHEFDCVPDFVESLIGREVQVASKDTGVCGILVSVNDDFLNISRIDTVYSVSRQEIVRFIWKENTVDEPVIKDGEFKMSSDRFKALLDELDGSSLQTMKERNTKYSRNGDALHNFRQGAAINRNTLAQTCWGYMSKHLVALQDKVERNDFSDRDDLLEKCQDTINYIRFLWCIANDDEPEHVDRRSDTYEFETSDNVYVAHTTSDQKLLHAIMIQLLDRMKLRGRATKADLLFAIGINYDEEDKKMGWTSLEGANIVPYDIDGYALILPEPKEL